MEGKIQQLNIWKKLFEIQKDTKTFAVSEESEKKTGNGKSAYQYTPGWEIVESIREKMDKAKLMLIPCYRKDDVQLIEYPLYKLINGKAVTFTKKEIHIVITATFTWLDIDSGEMAGPFEIVASGANGTDKSCASALALAERYFLLKFFHITTHEKDDEPDAHDSGTVPGIPSSEQPYNVPYNAAPQPEPQKVICPVMPPAPMCYGPQAYYGQPNNMMPVQGQYGPAPQGVMPQVQPATAPVAATPGAGFDPNHPAIIEAVTRLSNYQAETQTYQTELNKIICELTNIGFRSFDPVFLENLREASQAKREGRTPNLK